MFPNERKHDEVSTRPWFYVPWKLTMLMPNGSLSQFKRVRVIRCVQHRLELQAVRITWLELQVVELTNQLEETKQRGLSIVICVCLSVMFMCS